MMRRRRSTTDAAKLSKVNAGQPKRRGSPTGKKPMGFGRSKSVDVHPNKDQQGLPWKNIKGIMKITTLDESLHSVYGSESSQASEDTKRKRIRIQFENIEIREYARTVGDNPSVSSGPPMTIAWEYNPNTTVLSVEEYEKARPVRRTQSQMILPRSVRVEMLRKEWDVSNHQIVCAVRSGVRAKNQRRTTLGNLGRTEKVEEMIEGATKQLLKTLFLRKSTSTKAQELEKEIQRVNQQRAQIFLTRTMKGEYNIDESESSNPWNADLLQDESETDVGLASHPDSIPEEGKEKANQDRFRSSTTSAKDDKMQLPERPPSDVDLSSVGGDEQQQQQQQQPLQSTGESASQTQEASKPTRMRPVITAVEPESDDEDDLLHKASSMEKPQPSTVAPIDC